MRTFTSFLPLKYRSAVRFVLVGVLGTVVQYGIYYLLLNILHQKWPEALFVATLAFTVGFVIELIFNYILTSFYTFRVRLTLKNAGGFLIGRTLNYFIQIMLLNVLIWLEMSKEWAGITAIALAGIINYFVLLSFYKDKKREKKQSSSC